MGEGDSFFVNSVALGGSTMNSGRPHARECIGSMNLERMGFKKLSKKEDTKFAIGW